MTVYISVVNRERNTKSRSSCLMVSSIFFLIVVSKQKA